MLSTSFWLASFPKNVFSSSFTNFSVNKDHTCHTRSTFVTRSRIALAVNLPLMFLYVLCKDSKILGSWSLNSVLYAEALRTGAVLLYRMSDTKNNLATFFGMGVSSSESDSVMISTISLASSAWSSAKPIPYAILVLLSVRPLRRSMNSSLSLDRSLLLDPFFLRSRSLPLARSLSRLSLRSLLSLSLSRSLPPLRLGERSLSLDDCC
mmetsp:Transcript_12001/g.21903  ORF Transcript_12001/g.21903 Transcript_12001/m.21903 type:complete len:208 (+) Transcript_12001:458-1081(+)